MKILSIGSDRNLFIMDSQALSRVIEYAKKTEEYHIIVFSSSNLNLSKKQIGNLYLYPTNSFSKFSYFMGGLKIAREILKHSNNWIITTQDPFEAGLVGYFLKRKLNIPLQIQIHTDFLDKHFKKNILNKFRVIIGKFLIKRADGIRVVSEVIKDSINKKFKNLRTKIDVLPIFVDVQNIIDTPAKRYIDKDFPHFKFIILMASRLTKEKRIDLGIKAMPEILHKYPHTGLVICGSGKEKRKLQAYVKHLKIEKNVIFAGWQDDLLSYYKTANLFLLTSEYEGYGMTLIEAGAAGCPIVTTKVGIAKTSLFASGVNCEVCEFFDYKCVSNNVVSLIEDNQRRELFKHKMQDSIRAISGTQKDYIEKYIGLLKELVDNHD